MLGEGTSEIFITFLLAITGYIGLTITLLISLKSNLPSLFWKIVAGIILVHVIMVWTFRYDWQFSLAVRNGYAGFIIFHSALMMIIFSTFAKERTAKILIGLSFIVVTIGAVGAVFRYDVVEIYRVPVMLCAIAGNGGFLFHYLKRK